MKPESPAVIDQEDPVGRHAREIEFALVLQRIITMVQNDPAQMRTAIYEYARAKLKDEASVFDETERARLMKSLETAIQGVERFSSRRDEAPLLPSPDASAQARVSNATAVATLTPAVPTPVTPVPLTPIDDDIVARAPYVRPELHPVLEVRTPPVVATLVSLFVGMLVFMALTGVIYYKSLSALFNEHFPQLNAQVARAPASPSAADGGQQVAPPEDIKAPPQANPLPYPVPTDYGIYALSDQALTELTLLPERVPDKRIAMSTPVTQPSRTTLPDGKAKFILFRRDLAGNAPERMDVRVVARVTRALTFDAKGKPNFIPISDAWNIRNISYEFRVRPIPGYPEMLLVQSEKPEFALPPGRYILVLKEQGYDFTVAGQITDLAQCLERTDAANGEFYSECQKR
jgi:hypothetical protein